MSGFFAVVEKWGLKAVTLLYAAGFFIHNCYLATFGIADFEVLQTRYIYVGSVAVSIFIGLTLIASLKMNVDNAGANLRPVPFAAWLTRLVLMCNLFVMIVSHWEVSPTIRIPVLGLVGQSARLFVFGYWGFSAVLFTLLLEDIYNRDNRPAPAQVRYRRFVRKLYAILAVPMLGAVPLLCVAIAAYRHTCFMVAGIALYVFSASEGRSVAGLYVPPALLDENSSELAKSWFDIAWRRMFLVFVVANIFSSYAIGVYADMAPASGGAKPAGVVIVAAQDTLRGVLIHENKEWLYVREDGGREITRLRAAQCQRIIMQHEAAWQSHADPKTVPIAPPGSE